MPDEGRDFALDALRFAHAALGVVALALALTGGAIIFSEAGHADQTMTKKIGVPLILTEGFLVSVILGLEYVMRLMARK